LQKLDRIGRPDTSKTSLDDLYQRCSISLDRANDDHDKIRVGVQVSGVSNAIVDLFASNDLLHHCDGDFNGQELAYFVDNVKGRVEDQVPEMTDWFDNSSIDSL